MRQVVVAEGPPTERDEEIPVALQERAERLTRAIAGKSDQGGILHLAAGPCRPGRPLGYHSLIHQQIVIGRVLQVTRGHTEDSGTISGRPLGLPGAHPRR
jgi:hypothetical protein